MRSLIVCSSAWLLAVAGSASAADRVEELQIETAAGPRSALVHPVHEPTSLVVLLHGFGSDAQQMRALTGYGFETLSSRAGWLVVYPQGVGKSWNDCRRTPQYPARAANIDDVAFLAELIGQLRTRHDIAPDRVLVGGFSNGGQMALRLALERPDTVGGMLLIGAQLPTAAESVCAEGGRAVNALLIAGTADRIAPYEGGASRGTDGAPLGTLDSVVSSAMRLASRGGQAVPSRRSLGDLDGNPSTSVDVTRWRAPEALVELYTVQGGGHTIPKRITTFPGMFGATSADIDTASVALAFMQRWSPRRVAGWQSKVDALRVVQGERRRLLAAAKARTVKATPPG